MKIYNRNTLAELVDLQSILQFISGSLLDSFNPKDIQRAADLVHINQIRQRIITKTLSNAHRPRTTTLKTWITIPELDTLSRVVTLYYFRLCPKNQITIRESYFNPALQSYHNIYITRQQN